jgi:hypothetical protein
MKKTVLTALTGIVVLGSTALPAMAQDRYYDRHYNQNQNRFEWQEHPYLKKALIGGGGGAVLGGLISSDGGRMDGAITGALLGAGAGLGYEYLKNKGILPNDGW